MTVGAVFKKIAADFICLFSSVFVTKAENGLGLAQMNQAVGSKDLLHHMPYMVTQLVRLPFAVGRLKLEKELLAFRVIA